MFQSTNLVWPLFNLQQEIRLLKQRIPATFTEDERLPLDKESEASARRKSIRDSLATGDRDKLTRVFSTFDLIVEAPDLASSSNLVCMEDANVLYIRCPTGSKLEVSLNGETIII